MRPSCELEITVLREDRSGSQPTETAVDTQHYISWHSSGCLEAEKHCPLCDRFIFQWR